MEVLIVPFDSSLSAACWWLLEVWFTAPTVTAIYQIMPASRSLAVWTPSLLRHTRPCWEGLHGFGSLNQPQKLSWMSLFASASSAADVTVAGLAVSGWHGAEYLLSIFASRRFGAFVHWVCVLANSPRAVLRRNPLWHPPSASSVMCRGGTDTSGLGVTICFHILLSGLGSHPSF